MNKLWAIVASIAGVAGLAMLWNSLLTQFDSWSVWQFWFVVQEAKNKYSCDPWTWCYLDMKNGAYTDMKSCIADCGTWGITCETSVELDKKTALATATVTTTIKDSHGNKIKPNLYHGSKNTSSFPMTWDSQEQKGLWITKLDKWIHTIWSEISFDGSWSYYWKSSYYFKCSTKTITIEQWSWSCGDGIIQWHNDEICDYNNKTLPSKWCDPWRICSQQCVCIKPVWCWPLNGEKIYRKNGAITEWLITNREKTWDDKLGSETENVKLNHYQKGGWWFDAPREPKLWCVLTNEDKNKLCPGGLLATNWPVWNKRGTQIWSWSCNNETGTIWKDAGYNFACFVHCSFCGDGTTDTELGGETCDDGEKNGTPWSPCTKSCTKKLPTNTIDGEDLIGEPTATVDGGWLQWEWGWR